MNGLVVELRQQRRQLIESATAEEQTADYIAEQVIKLSALIDGVKAAADDENQSKGQDGYIASR